MLKGRSRVRFLGILLVLGLSLFFLTGLSVYALFNSPVEKVTNKFTVGHLSTELVEAVFESRGTTLHKEPFVSNTGTVDCLVRLKVIVDPEEIWASSVFDKPDEESILESRNKGYKFWIDFQDSWTYNSDDGYWYYNGVVKPGQDTTPLFTTVNWLDIDEDGNWLDYQDFDIYVYKEDFYSETITKDGIKVSAVNSSGEYSMEEALRVWSLYEG